MRRLLLALLALPALAAVPAPASALTVGIADQKADFLDDSRFLDLGVRHARISVPWDVLRDPATRDRTDHWVRAARARGVRVLVTFDRSRRPGKASVTPSPRQLASELRRMRQRWPWLREFSTWNEANINKKADTVARQWNALRKACRSCTILGADLLDRANASRWAKRFVRVAGRHPKAWGLHNYADANRFSTKGTRKLLRTLRGQVWLTETGGVVARRNGSSVRFAGSGDAHAARATAFLFDRLARLSSRIKRVYVYQWNVGAADLSWDSAFIGPDGAERPALGVFRQRLGSRR